MVASTGFIVSCSSDGVIFVWDYVKGTHIHMYQQREELRCLLYRPAVRQLFSGSEQCNIVVYELPSSVSVSLCEAARLRHCDVQ